MNDQTKKLKLEFFNKLLEANPQIKAQYDDMQPRYSAAKACPAKRKHILMK